MTKLPSTPSRLAQEMHLWTLLSEGSEEQRADARDQLVERHRRLVDAVVFRKFRWFWFDQSRHLDKEDLINEGMIGLLRAIDKFDHTRGLAFSTMATHWIYQAVQRAIEEQEHAIRLPAHVHLEIRRTLNAGGTTQQAQVTASLDDRFEEDGEALGELIPDFAAAARTIDHAELSEFQATVQQALRSLPRREAAVLRMVFGFDGPPLSAEEIGRRMGVSRGLAWLLKERGLLKLRRILVRSPNALSIDEIELLHVPVKGCGPRPKKRARRVAHNQWKQVQR